MKDTARVWYGGFGANLNDERLRLYLAGGSMPGLNRVYLGSRDTSAPAEFVTCVTSGSMRFAGYSRTWGSGGGAAFFSPGSGSSCVMRASRITVVQLADLVMQENGLCPHEDGDLAEAIMGMLVPAIASSEVSSGSLGYELLSVLCLPQRFSYDVVNFVPALTLDGRMLRLAVLGSSDAPPRSPPPAEYAAAIHEGLVRSCGLSVSAADAYLSRCLSRA